MFQNTWLIVLKFIFDSFSGGEKGKDTCQGNRLTQLKFESIFYLFLILFWNITSCFYINGIGDGGSPLNCEIPNNEYGQYYVTGEVAWGIGCFDPLPGVYVNVTIELLIANFIQFTNESICSFVGSKNASVGW